MTTAITLLTILSRKTGRASIANEFMSSSVTNSQCLLERIGSTLEATSFSSSVPLVILSSIVRSSIERYPTVRPDINPANRVRTIQLYNELTYIEP